MQKKFKKILLGLLYSSLVLGSISLIYICLTHSLTYEPGYMGLNNLFEIFRFPINIFSLSFAFFSVLLVLERMQITANNNLSNNAINLIYKSIEEIEKILDSENPKKGIIMNLENEIIGLKEDMPNTTEIINSLERYKTFLETRVGNDYITNRIFINNLCNFQILVNPENNHWSNFALKKLTIQFKLLAYNLALLEKHSSDFKGINNLICNSYLEKLKVLKKLGLPIEDSVITYFYHCFKQKGKYPFDNSKNIDKATLKIYQENLDSWLNKPCV